MISAVPGQGTSRILALLTAPPPPFVKFLSPCCDYNFLHEIEVTTLQRWVIFLIPQNDGKIDLGNDAQETDPVRVSGMEGGGRNSRRGVLACAPLIPHFPSRSESV